MKSAIILCSVAAFIGSIIKLIVGSTSSTRIHKALSNVIGIVLLLAFIRLVFSADIPSFSYTPVEKNYESIGNDILENVITNAESEVEQQIIEKLVQKFKISPTKCDIKIDKQTFEVTAAEITLNRADILISTYEIINFIKSEFEIDAEVSFL